jgi:hypothetical protein
MRALTPRERARRAIVRRRIAAGARELWRVRDLAQRSELRRGMQFVFLCSRCAQKGLTKRVRVTAEGHGDSFEHELPVCDSFKWAFGLPRGQGWGRFGKPKGWRF